MKLPRPEPETEYVLRMVAPVLQLLGSDPDAWLRLQAFARAELPSAEASSLGIRLYPWRKMGRAPSSVMLALLVRFGFAEGVIFAAAGPKAEAPGAAAARGRRHKTPS